MYLSALREIASGERRPAAYTGLIWPVVPEKIMIPRRRRIKKHKEQYLADRRSLTSGGASIST